MSDKPLTPEKLLREVRCLVRILEEAQPGLFSWLAMFHSQMEIIIDLYDPTIRAGVSGGEKDKA